MIFISTFSQISAFSSHIMFECPRANWIEKHEREIIRRSEIKQKMFLRGLGNKGFSAFKMVKKMFDMLGTIFIQAQLSN